MFKIDSFEAELYESMSKNLLTKQAEEKHNFNKIAKAVDYLNNAAELFEKAGMDEESYEVLSVLNSVAQAAMPAFTTMPANWETSQQPESSKIYPSTWKGVPVRLNEKGEKYIIHPGLLQQIKLPPELQKATPSKNKYNLAEQDIERVQLGLNKIIKDYTGQKPQTLLPDQKWGPLTEAAFNWYDKLTHNSPIQSLKALLNNTGKNETISGMK